MKLTRSFYITLFVVGIVFILFRFVGGEQFYDRWFLATLVVGLALAMALPSVRNSYARLPRGLYTGQIFFILYLACAATKQAFRLLVGPVALTVTIISFAFLVPCLIFLFKGMAQWQKEQK